MTTARLALSHTVACPSDATGWPSSAARQLTQVLLGSGVLYAASWPRQYKVLCSAAYACTWGQRLAATLPHALTPSCCCNGHRVYGGRFWVIGHSSIRVSSSLWLQQSTSWRWT